MNGLGVKSVAGLGVAALVDLADALDNIVGLDVESIQADGDGVDLVKCAAPMSSQSEAVSVAGGGRHLLLRTDLVVDDPHEHLSADVQRLSTSFRSRLMVSSQCPVR